MSKIKDHIIAEHNKPEHSPLPWELVAVANSQIYVNDANDLTVAMFDISKEHEKADSEFIVRACNNHDKLVEILKAAKNMMQRDEYDNNSDWADQIVEMEKAIAEAEK